MEERRQVEGFVGGGEGWFGSRKEVLVIALVEELEEGLGGERGRGRTGK